MKRPEIRGLYYITHIDNVPSILERGILSHERVTSENIQYARIYSDDIVENRREKQTPDGNSLWHFANLYFWPRNPMLYRVLCEKSAREVAVISARHEILDRLDIFISDGNAAHSQTEILALGKGRKAIPQIIKDTLMIEYWNEEDGSKRKIMAECLVPNFVAPETIQTIYVATQDAKASLGACISNSSVPIIVEPNMFFLPSRRRVLTSNLFLAEGDLFFSHMQTLTVSVNIVGVMGKGLASRAKHQFPRVYVYYQDLCHNGKLKMGRPQLYKRELPLEHELADVPETLSNYNSQKWFLLFPTKRHWKEQADIKGIEEGLQWLAGNYKKEGIKSLAIPALGCGLGKLDWRDVGPLMCRYLKTFDVSVAIYLPSEKKIDEALLAKEFLIK